MAYDEELAARIRAELSTKAEFEEKKMFGGLAFMVNTHMACGITGKDALMVRVGKDGYDAALAAGAREMDMGGRPMRGMVMIPSSTVADPARFAEWIETAARVALADPPKKPKKPKTAG